MMTSAIQAITARLMVNWKSDPRNHTKRHEDLFRVFWCDFVESLRGTPRLNGFLLFRQLDVHLFERNAIERARNFDLLCLLILLQSRARVRV